jgi:hypothetical protein
MMFSELLVCYEGVGAACYVTSYLQGGPSFVCDYGLWGLLHGTRLASRKIVIEQNIKRQTGPALYVFRPWVTTHPFTSVNSYSKNKTAVTTRQVSRLDTL